MNGQVVTDHPLMISKDLLRTKAIFLIPYMTEWEILFYSQWGDVYETDQTLFFSLPAIN